MALRPIFYDTETTGIRPDKDRIIEIAAYDPVRGTSFVTFVNPGCPIPPEASAIHHITDEMVSTAHTFKEVGLEFQAFCEGEVVLIAHNNDSFDLPFIKNEYSRHSLSMPSWKFFDTLKWARRYRPDLPKHTLQFLRELYGIPPNNAHRALDDVMVLHEIFTLMTDDLPMEHVYELINKKKALLSMPFGKYQGQPFNAVPKDYLKWLKSSGALDKPENLELSATISALGLFA